MTCALLIYLFMTFACVRIAVTCFGNWAFQLIPQTLSLERVAQAQKISTKNLCKQRLGQIVLYIFIRSVFSLTSN